VQCYLVWHCVTETPHKREDNIKVALEKKKMSCFLSKSIRTETNGGLVLFFVLNIRQSALFFKVTGLDSYAGPWILRLSLFNTNIGVRSGI
jgi:hypothetical protein